MNSTIQLILITILILFIYNNLNKKDDQFQSTNNINLSNEEINEKLDEETNKTLRLNNPKLESIKRYINDKQKLLEDVNHYNCNFTDNGIDILKRIKDLKIEKQNKENELGELPNIEDKTENIDKIQMLKSKIKTINEKLELENNKLNNKYCPKLLKDTSTNNLKTSSFLENIYHNQNYNIHNLNENIKDYKKFSNNYSVLNEPAISESLQYINPYLEMKSFNDNVSTLEMMQDTLEFSNQVPSIVEEKEIIRLFPYNFTDFNGDYSINLGNFNPTIIDNRHIVKIQINTNEDIDIEEAKALNLSGSSMPFNNSNLNDNTQGSLKVFDANGDTIFNFDIINIARAELPTFPTTTIFMNIKSQNIYQDPNKSYTTEELMLKYKKIKLLKNIGLKDGGVYLHGNDGQFNLYNFNKLLILNMSPI